MACLSADGPKAGFAFRIHALGCAPMRHLLAFRLLLCGVALIGVALIGCDDARRGPSGDTGSGDTAFDTSADASEDGTADSSIDASVDAPTDVGDDTADSAIADTTADMPTPDTGPGGFDPRAGDLVVVEIQGNPVRANDEEAEYIELVNVSGRALNLQGVVLAHHSWVGDTPPDRSTSFHTIDESVVVDAGGRALLVRSAGGFFGDADSDYAYDDFVFSNADTEFGRVRLMVARWDGTEPPAAGEVIDEVILEPRVFANAVRGRAWQFDEDAVGPSTSRNDLPSNWCTASPVDVLEYRTENYGTPGMFNDCE